MSKPTYRLFVRRYPGARFVSVWLERGQTPRGPWSSLMLGEVIPRVVQDLEAGLGLAVVYEERPVEGYEPMSGRGCVPLAKQGELFEPEGKADEVP